MNIGANNDKTRQYDTDKMLEDSKNASFNNSLQNMLLSDYNQAIEWYDQRGNSGDNVPISTFRNLENCIQNKDTENFIKISVSILERQMHPTARDIMLGCIKNGIYNLCGKRAYTYEK